MTMNKRQQKWYDLGVEYAKECSSEKDAFWMMDNDLLQEMTDSGDYSNGLFFHAGFVGREPEWRIGFRYGEIPEAGRSVNHAENRWESGVSCICLDDDHDSIYDVTLGYQGIEKIKIEGWYIGGSGSDGEPLLIDCVKA